MTRFGANWGGFERIVLLMLLAVMGMVQALLFTEVFSGAGADVQAAFDAAYGLVGLSLIYLLITAGADWLEQFITVVAQRREPIVPPEYLGAGVWALGAVAMAFAAVESATVIAGYPDLTQAIRLVGGSFVALLALRAIPQPAWTALYRRLRALRGARGESL